MSKNIINIFFESGGKIIILRTLTGASDDGENRESGENPGRARHCNQGLRIELRVRRPAC